MRIVCLVPSLTETLIEAGLDVVGRTRFCIHPHNKVKTITAVGGTKDLNWEKIKALKPDLLVLDQEENLPWMKSEAPCEVVVSHITSIEEMRIFANRLTRRFPENLWLKDFAKRWQAIQDKERRTWNWDNIPGVIDSWIDTRENFSKIRYVIWRKPWMSVGQETFIASVFERLGADPLLFSEVGTQKYPIFDEEDFKNRATAYLFSSEPYPFKNIRNELSQLTRNGALVDGESYSWFGIRSLRFLEMEGF